MTHLGLSVVLCLMLLILVGALGTVAYQKRATLQVGPSAPYHSSELQSPRGSFGGIREVWCYPEHDGGRTGYFLEDNWMGVNLLATLKFYFSQNASFHAGFAMKKQVETYDSKDSFFILIQKINPSTSKECHFFSYCYRANLENIF